MTTTEMFQLGKDVLFVIYVLITIILLIRNKIKNNKLTGSTGEIDILDTFKEALTLCNNTIDQMETAFNSIAREGAKTGLLKKNAVLTTVQQFLSKNSNLYEVDFWSDYIDKVIAIKNNDEFSKMNENTNIVTIKGE